MSITIAMGDTYIMGVLIFNVNRNQRYMGSGMLGVGASLSKKIETITNAQGQLVYMSDLGVPVELYKSQFIDRWHTGLKTQENYWMDKKYKKKHIKKELVFMRNYITWGHKKQIAIRAPPRFEFLKVTGRIPKGRIEQTIQ